MSTTPRTDRPSDAQALTMLATVATRSASSLAAVTVTGVRAVAFWVAVALPFCYLPLLVGGLGGGELTLLAALVVANALALVVGHEHAPRTP